MRIIAWIICRWCKIGEDAQQRAQMQNGPRKNLTILIVGETSRAANFSLGGYAHETNPRLKQDNVVYFPNTTSCGTATAVSVPCMFSNMPRQNYDEELAHHQEGVAGYSAARRYSGIVE
jgi:lipid A ethanolaminephosphotransferase